MDRTEITDKMKNIINNSERSTYISKQNNNLSNSEQEWINSLPFEKDNLFIYLELEDNRVVICIREIDWYTKHNIEVMSYRNVNGDIYYDGEFERREILSDTINWVAELNSLSIIYNMNNDILSKLNYTLVDNIWNKYSTTISLSLKEANALYTASKAYFSKKVNNTPIPSIVVEVDMMIHFCKLSRDELRNIKYSEMEKIKLILKARSEVLGLNEISEEQPFQ
jgi:hypothetical protein